MMGESCVCLRSKETQQDTYFEFSSAFKTFWDLKNYVGFAQNKVPIFISFHQLWGDPSPIEETLFMDGSLQQITILTFMEAS